MDVSTCSSGELELQKWSNCCVETVRLSSAKKLLSLQFKLNQSSSSKIISLNYTIKSPDTKIQQEIPLEYRHSRMFSVSSWQPNYHLISHKTVPLTCCRGQLYPRVKCTCCLPLNSPNTWHKSSRSSGNTTCT